jgi:hypothetical protein
MPDLDEDINERVEKTVEEVLTKREAEDPSNVAEKAREY